MDAIREERRRVDGSQESSPRSDRDTALEDRTIVQTVWAAEDGRCQVCARPMDKQMARIRAYDGEALPTLDNTFLICPICTRHWASPIPDARVRGDLAEALSQARDQEKALAAAWLREQLEAYGVLVGGNPKKGWNYWLPGVGLFRCRRRAGKPPLLTGKVEIRPELTRRPQAQSRGLPRPTWDRSRLWGMGDDAS